VPRAWAVSPAALGAHSLGSTQVDGTPDIVDVRPHVEVALQRRALHGQPRLAAPAALAAVAAVGVGR
jgi:hypothetical protein